ncbi:MAG: VanW family protein [Fimbriimonadaceae bacterium]|nr:VanW family protein [Fimbriimonadaceae bacterium]
MMPARPMAMIGVLLLVGAGVGLAAVLRQAPRSRVVAAYITRFDGRDVEQRHNARIALQKLSGATIPPGATFSFNERVRTWSRDQGYKKAPVSYGGHLIPFWGGGVCQTSTTLYNVALLGGLEVVERHRHQFAPGYVPPGRDAAVAYPNIDLRFCNRYDFPVTITGRVEGSKLIVELTAPRDLPERPRIVQEGLALRPPMMLTAGFGDSARLRNPGKPGAQVVTYRVWRARREFLSADSYPVMHRIVERS